MSFSTNTTFRKPRKPAPPKERKAINRVGRKGEFWAFCAEIVRKFQKRIGIPERCEVQGAVCDGRNLTWAHTTRRWTITAKEYAEDWYHALRVLRACGACHYDADSQGGPAAEEILEPIVAQRFKDFGLSEDDVKRILIECAEEVKQEFADMGRFQEYEVSF